MKGHELIADPEKKALEALHARLRFDINDNVCWSLSVVLYVYTTLIYDTSGVLYHTTALDECHFNYCVLYFGDPRQGLLI